MLKVDKLLRHIRPYPIPTRFENVRLWYRNSLFPRVSRLDNPLPVSIPTIIDLFKRFRQTNFDPVKPGTDVSMEDLLAVTDYYIEREYNNPESLDIHRKIQLIAGTIKELEDAMPG